MKDKIIQITGLGEARVIALTDLGRMLNYNVDFDRWVEIEVPKALINMEDGIPRFDFGKYKGQPIEEAPTKYLEWCRENRDDFYWAKDAEGKLITLEDDLPF